MNKEFESYVISRGITRLCHFTPARNLVHIAGHQDGIRSSNSLRADQNACFTATDSKRLDGYEGHICCSVEYPNAWYLTKAEQKELIFKDWVVLFIAPHYLWHPDTLYCPRNAAASGGAHVVQSLAGFHSLFGPRVTGAYGQTFVRGGHHLNCSPTDDQAEVLVKSDIALSDIVGVAVKSESQAKNEISRLRLSGFPSDTFQFFIAPQLFEKYHLASSIRAGKRPNERPY